MAVYWMLIVCSAVLGIPLCGLYEKKSGKRLTVYCIVMGAVLFAVSAFRLSVGYDYNMYATLFYDMNFMTYEEIGHIQREMGMLFPVKLLEVFTYDYFPAFVMLSAVIYPLLMIYIRKYSDNPWIAVFAFLALGVFFNSLNFLRQFIAALICAFAYRYAQKGKFLRFAVFVLLAASFHRSAFLIIPCYVFVLIEMNGLILFFTLITSICAYLLSDIGLELVTEFIYTNYDPTKNAEIMTGLPPMYAVMFGAVFAAAFLLRSRIQAEEREKNILLWCSYGAFFFEFMGTKHGIVSRIALLFFIPVVCLLLPKVFIAARDVLKEKLSGGKWIAAVFLMALMCLNYGLLLQRNYNGVLPYCTVAERGGGESG